MWCNVPNDGGWNGIAEHSEWSLSIIPVSLDHEQSIGLSGLSQVYTGLERFIPTLHRIRFEPGVR